MAQDLRADAKGNFLRLQKLGNITAKPYEDKTGTAISKNAFMALTQRIEQKQFAKAERLNALLSEIHQPEKDAASIQNWSTVIRKHLYLQGLDRETIDELTDQIEIGKRAVIDRQIT